MCEYVNVKTDREGGRGRKRERERECMYVIYIYIYTFLPLLWIGPWWGGDRDRERRKW